MTRAEWTEEQVMGPYWKEKTKTQDEEKESWETLLSWERADAQKAEEKKFQRLARELKQRQELELEMTKASQSRMLKRAMEQLEKEHLDAETTTDARRINAATSAKGLCGTWRYKPS